MLTKDHKRKIKTLWEGGFERRVKALILQAWELFQAIDPSDKEFEMELRNIREEESIEWAAKINSQLLKIIEDHRNHYEDNLIFFHDSYSEKSHFLKERIDKFLKDLRKAMIGGSALSQVDEIYNTFAYGEIPYADDGRG